MPVEGIDETVIGSSYPALGQPGSRDFQDPMWRIDVHVFDHDVYMLTSENTPPTFDDVGRELRLYKGFQSVPFETAVTAVKFKAVTGTARVTVHAFA